MKYTLNNDDFERLSEIYRLFGSAARLKILLCLQEQERDVKELQQACELSQSATSHQLRDLKNCRIVKSRKVGQQVFYSLDDAHISGLLESGIEHVKGVHCYEE